MKAGWLICLQSQNRGLICEGSKAITRNNCTRVEGSLETRGFKGHHSQQLHARGGEPGDGATGLCLAIFRIRPVKAYMGGKNNAMSTRVSAKFILPGVCVISFSCRVAMIGRLNVTVLL